MKDNSRHLIFKTRDELSKVKLENVAYFEVDGNYTTVVFTNGLKLQILISLSSIEKLIDETLRGKIQPFIRIGKGYIVNSVYICHINVLKQTLILSDYVSPQIHTLHISKEALKNLKDLYKTKTTWK